MPKDVAHENNRRSMEMETSSIWVCAPGEELPAVEAPFSILVNTDEEEWSDARFVRRLARDLLAQGARYFVCFGQRSEPVHDYIDDVIAEEGYDGVTTTYHDDESKQQVVDFLMKNATRGMRGALVLVRDASDWKACF